MILSGRHKRLMQYAIRRANQAPMQKFRLGCVIAKGRDVISSGVNNMGKTHPRAIDYDYPFVHAELDAMIGVDAEELRGSYVYVARRRIGVGGSKENPSKVGMAKPCSYCLEQMRKHGLKGVFYTTYDNQAEYMDLR